jgi:Helix-turn-helix domain
MSSSSDERLLIPLQDVGRLLAPAGASPIAASTLALWIRTGKLPPVRILGKRKYVLKSDLDEWAKGLPVEQAGDDRRTQAATAKRKKSK